MRFLLLSCLAFAVSLGSPQNVRHDVNVAFKEQIGADLSVHLEQLKRERELIAEDVYTEIKLMDKATLEQFKEDLDTVKGANHFEDEDEDEICQLCGAIRLLPRCRKPVDGLPTRPKICRACLIYVATCVL